jgi:hypothetical protein
MSLFGEYQVRIDPWQAEYGPELAADYESELPREVVLEDVDLPRGLWQPITPSPARVPRNLMFADGVRRIEARIQIPRLGGVVYGAFGSYAVGSVHILDGKASFGEVKVDRVVATGAGIELPQLVPVMSAAHYRPVHTPNPDVDGPLQRIQEEMRRAEEVVARKLADLYEALVITDGPLTFQGVGRGHTVGYIKRILEFYVSDPSFLGTLPSGTRTPLFAIRTQRRFARYAWFTRVSEPYIGDSPLSGIARLEISEDAGLSVARDLADATTLILPRFAPNRGRDPRAPQNLAPIGALELYLRHMMGDRELLRRYIEQVIRTEARRG